VGRVISFGTGARVMVSDIVSDVCVEEAALTYEYNTGSTTVPYINVVTP
jgi:hypothetical protein